MLKCNRMKQNVKTRTNERKSSLALPIPHYDTVKYLGMNLNVRLNSKAHIKKKEKNLI